jgi:hypothetical protein
MDEADDPDTLDYFTLHKEAPIHYNIDEDKDQAALEAEVDDNVAMEVDDECGPLEEDKGMQQNALKRAC